MARSVSNWAQTCLWTKIKAIPVLGKHFEVELPETHELFADQQLRMPSESYFELLAAHPQVIRIISA